MTLERITDNDGQVKERETRKNIKDDEVEQFKKDWLSHNVPAKQQIKDSKKDEKKQIKQE